MRGLKCSFLKDSRNKFANLCLDILPIYHRNTINQQPSTCANYLNQVCLISFPFAMAMDNHCALQYQTTCSCLQINRPEFRNAVLLAALVQTIYTTYSNDGIHLRVGTYEVLVFVISWLRRPTTHPLPNRKIYGCSYLVNSWGLLKSVVSVTTL
jgi:hypothetical protein